MFQGPSVAVVIPCYLPAGSTVLLDRVCPYGGPGVVFETWWDTGPALSLTLGRKLDADVISEEQDYGIWYRNLVLR